MCFRCVGKGNIRCKSTSKSSRRACSAARLRQEEMTEPGEKRVGGLLANSAQQVLRPVSRELLPLPVPFPDKEKSESERLRGLSRAVSSWVNRRVACHDWANAGVRSMNEIFSRTSASEAGSRSSAMQLNSLQCLSVGQSCRTVELASGKLPYRSGFLRGCVTKSAENVCCVASSGGVG